MDKETPDIVSPQTKPENESKFTVLLNGQRDLEEQLVEFKKACQVHDHKQRRKRSKRRRYYNLALMAKIMCQTTPEELRRLLKNGTRTFLVDVVTNKESDIEKMTSMLRDTVAELQAEDPYPQLVAGLAVEIAGDCCRIGRIRNNCSVFLEKDDIMTLTTELSYKYSGFKEICYVINLKYYVAVLQLQQELKIGYEVRGRIVKKLRNSVAILIESPGIINSYEYLELPNQCYSLHLKVMPDMLAADLELAAKLKADIIVVPRIRCLPFLKLLSYSIKQKYNVKLLGTIDLEYVSSKMLDIMAIIKLLDFLWLPNLFHLSDAMHSYISQEVIPIAKCLKKPLIGSVPLERCSDFHAYSNHEFLWKIDCISIEKSKWCNKYPLIVKKLLPIKDYRIGVVNTTALRDILTSYQSVVNFIIRTISSIECQAIFMYARCETAAAALSRVEIYCPVFVILPLDDGAEEEVTCRLQLAKSLNLRRNLRPIVYTKEMNECEYEPIDFGIEYARSCGCIETGDFVITIEVGKEGGEDGVQLGVGEDVVIMRAFYVPPMKIGEKCIC